MKGSNLTFKVLPSLWLDNTSHTYGHGLCHRLCIIHELFTKIVKITTYYLYVLRVKYVQNTYVRLRKLVYVCRHYGSSVNFIICIGCGGFWTQEKKRETNKNTHAILLNSRWKICFKFTYNCITIDILDTTCGPEILNG